MSKQKKDVLRPVDDEARRLAKTLIRTARFAALGTLEADGAPAVSRVSVATAMDGRVGFLISGLSGHFVNLSRDPRCSLLVGEPGKGDPLAHPRLTLIGRARRLIDGAERAHIRARYLMHHPKSALYADFGDFAFWLLEPERASLNGGFGKAFALTPADLLSAAPDDLAAMEAGAVEHMNTDHADAVDRMAAKAGGEKAGWRLSSLDPEGIDMSRGDHAVRLWFPRPLSSAGEVRGALIDLSKA